MKKIDVSIFVLIVLFFNSTLLTNAKDRFVHPGGLHTQADLDRMKTKVAEGAHPWIDGWNLLIKDPLAQNTYKATPRERYSVNSMWARGQAWEITVLPCVIILPA